MITNEVLPIAKVRMFPAPLYVTLLLLYVVLFRDEIGFIVLFLVGLLLSVSIFRRTTLHEDRIENSITFHNIFLYSLDVYEKSIIVNVSHSRVDILATGDSGHADVYNIILLTNNGERKCICSLDKKIEAEQCVNDIRTMLSLPAQ